MLKIIANYSESLIDKSEEIISNGIEIEFSERKHDTLFSLLSEIEDYDFNKYYLILLNKQELNLEWIFNSKELIRGFDDEVFRFKSTSFLSSEQIFDDELSSSNTIHLPSYLIKGSVLTLLKNSINYEDNLFVLKQERIFCSLLNKLFKIKKFDSPLSFTYTKINGRFIDITTMNNDRNKLIDSTSKFLVNVSDRLNIKRKEWNYLMVDLSHERFRLLNLFLFIKLTIIWGIKISKKYFSLKNPIYFSLKYDNNENIDVIDFESFKSIRNDLAKVLLSIFEKYSIKAFPVAMSGLGQILFGEPIDYDDDIDLTVDLINYNKNFNLIKNELKSNNIILQKWTDRKGHRSVIGVDKVYSNKLYRVIDEKYNIDALVSPFVDIGFYLNFNPDKIYLYEKFENNMKILKRFGQNSNLFSIYRSRDLEKNSWNMEKSFKPLSLTPYKIFRNILILKYKLLLRMALSEEYVQDDKLYTIDANMDIAKWGLVIVRKGGNFLGYQLYEYDDINELFYKRYNHTPTLLENSAAVPSHLNYESINYLYNKKHWLNSKTAKKEIKIR